MNRLEEIADRLVKRIETECVRHDYLVDESDGFNAEEARTIILDALREARDGRDSAECKQESAIESGVDVPPTAERTQEATLRVRIRMDRMEMAATLADVPSMAFSHERSEVALVKLLSYHEFLSVEQQRDGSWIYTLTLPIPGSQSESGSENSQVPQGDGSAPVSTPAGEHLAPPSETVPPQSGVDARGDSK
jgi:hypothetical protein